MQHPQEPQHHDSQLRDLFARRAPVTGRNTMKGVLAFLEQSGRVLSEARQPAKRLAAVATLAAHRLEGLCVINWREGDIEREVVGCDRLHDVAAVRGQVGLDPSFVARAERLAAAGEAVVWGSGGRAGAQFEGAPMPSGLRALGVHDFIWQPLVCQARPAGYLLFCTTPENPGIEPTDISVVALLADRISSALETLQARQEVQDPKGVRQEVSSVIAHDAGNLLSVISLKAEALLSGEPKITSKARAILRATRQIENLFRDVLDVACIDGGHFELQCRAHDLISICRAAIAEIRPAADGKDIGIAFAPASGTVEVICDRQRMAQVLANLLGNAVKFCHPGATVTLEVTQEDQAAVVRVRDTGPGIAEAQQTHVFDRYWRGHQTSAKQGTGLGLFICRAIIEAHDGRVALHSRPGKGSTFTFELPRGPSSGRRPILGPAHQVGGRSVLIIDDEPEVREAAAEVLRLGGYCVNTAANGAEGLARLRQDALPDVILLDVNMPIMNGHDFLKHVRADERTARLPVILVTGAAGVRHGFDECVLLRKPFRADALIGACNEVARRP